VQKRRNLSFADACTALGAVDNPLPTTQTPAQPKPDNGPPPEEWQARARLVIDDCERFLWSDGEWPDKARAYLAARGLRDAALLGWRLGYSLGGEMHGHFLERGIVIPWVVGTTAWKLNVKLRTGSDPKYKAVVGSKNGGLYGAGRPGNTLPNVVVTEGEFDALLVWQEASDMVDVLSLGSAGARVNDRWLPALRPFRRFWIATDNDPSGNKAATDWLGVVGERGTRLLPPGGAKDITDAWAAGADVRQWVMEAIK